MVYNVTLTDIHGYSATVYVSPDRPPVVTDLPIATNHQGIVEWPHYAELTGTVERKEVMERMYANLFENEAYVTNKFLEPPLFNYNYEKNFGTLYTVNYQVTKRQVMVHWPDNQILIQSFDYFKEDLVSVFLPRRKKQRMLI